MRASNAKRHMRGSVSPLFSLGLRTSDCYHVNTESNLMLLPDRFNVHQELGEDPLTSQKINYALRKTNIKESLQKSV